MREDRLYNVSGSTAAITFSIAAACLLSLTAFFFYEPQVYGTEGVMSPLFKNLLPSHFGILINFGAILISGLLLLWINNTYTIIRAHSSLPILFFLLFECSNPELTTTLRIGNLLVPIILLSTALLYSTYQSIRPQNQSFTFSLLITAGSLLWSPLIFFLPLFWIGLYQTRSLNLKSFCASVVGVITVLWLYYGGHFIWDYPLSFKEMRQIAGTIHWIHREGEIGQLIYFLPTVFIGFIAGISSFYRHYSDKICTRVYNEFINILSIFMITFYF